MYTGFGAVIKLKNENLVFSTIQIRLAYFPLVPEETNPEYLQITGVSDKQFNDFVVPRPEIVEYR